MIVRWTHGDPHEVVRGILADPRFGPKTSDKAPDPTMWDLFWRAVGDFFNKLFAGIDRVFGSNNPWNTALGILIGLALALALAYLVYRVATSYARSRDGALRARQGVSEGIEAERTAANLRKAALTAARAGHYREAAALLFRSAVRALDEAGRVPFDAARTPGEYRRLVRDPDFDRLATSAVVAIFASAEPQTDLFERMSAAYDAFFRRAAA